MTKPVVVEANVIETKSYYFKHYFRLGRNIKHEEFFSKGKSSISISKILQKFAGKRVRLTVEEIK